MQAIYQGTIQPVSGGPEIGVYCQVLDGLVRGGLV